VVGALLAADAETQVAVRDRRRYVARLTRPAREGLPQPYRMEISRPGDPDGLRLSPTTRTRPAPGQVEIAVEASGLNFRDVLNVLGMYPGDAGPLGLECAGRVAAAGEGVTDLDVGDPVLALASGTFARYVTVDRRLVARIPDKIGFAAAATLP